MKMKLKKSVVFFLLVTILAPIILFTDNLGVHFTSSSLRNEFVEDASALTFGGEIRALKVLPLETSTTFKEPLGMVYLENSTASGFNHSDDSSGENTRITRQLTEELEFAEEKSTNLSSLGSSNGDKQSSDENPIRQVIDRNHIVQIGEEKEKSNSNKLRGGHNEGTSKNVPRKREVGRRKNPSRPRGKQDEKPAIVDARVCLLKDLLIQAKVYLTLAATRNNPQFMRELRMRMKDVQQTIGSATKDSELPSNTYEKVKGMEQTLSKGRQIQDDCAAMVKKLRAMIQSSEEQFQVQKKQSLFLTQLAAKTIPKGLHCLPLRLSTEYFLLNASQQHFPNEEKLDDPKLFHYALFSDNILAASVVVNSTITHAKDPSKHVIHVVTDKLNYAAMKMWFLANPPGNATIQVQNVEEFTWLNSSYSPVLKQLALRSMIDYYFKNRHTEPDSNLKYRNPKYLSIMNHLRFYLPEIFPKLDKVLFLDDDVVVQKDLTGLWSLDLNGKVIGVVETCRETFHRFDHYLNFSNPVISKNFDPRACGWAFGMNIFDLNEWRKQNITNVYHKWQNLNQDRLLWKLGTLPPGLITFWNHTYALDKLWHVLGLGYNPNVSPKDIERAAVVHYNGNLKPWLEIAFPKFRNYWTKYVDYDQLYLRECNIAP